jgi:hypothetical protein
MSKLNKGLKIGFILSAAFFLFLFISSDKTDCYDCSFKYKGKTIDGDEAFNVFDRECLNHDNLKELPLNLSLDGDLPFNP